MIASPFIKTTNMRLNKRIIILFILFVLSVFLIRYLDGFLVNNVADGIVSFELAKEANTAKNIINSWDAVATAAVGYSLIFDFIFMAIYSLLLALLIHQVNEKAWKNTAFYKFGVALIYSPFLAAIFDAIENISLFQLFKNVTQFWTSMAFYFASAKFVLLGFGVLFVVVSWFIVLLNKQKN